MFVIDGLLETEDGDEEREDEQEGTVKKGRNWTTKKTKTRMKKLAVVPGLGEKGADEDNRCSRIVETKKRGWHQRQRTRGWPLGVRTQCDVSKMPLKPHFALHFRVQDFTQDFGFQPSHAELILHVLDLCTELLPGPLGVNAVLYRAPDLLEPQQFIGWYWAHSFELLDVFIDLCAVHLAQLRKRFLHKWFLVFVHSQC